MKSALVGITVAALSSSLAAAATLTVLTATATLTNADTCCPEECGNFTDWVKFDWTEYEENCNYSGRITYGSAWAQCGKRDTDCNGWCVSASKEMPYTNMAFISRKEWNEKERPKEE